MFLAFCQLQRASRASKCASHCSGSRRRGDFLRSVQVRHHVLALRENVDEKLDAVTRKLDVIPTVIRTMCAAALQRAAHHVTPASSESDTAPRGHPPP